MSELASRQQAFQRHLLQGDSAVSEHIVGDAKASAAARLDVYYQAYRLRLLEVLQNDFEGLHALLGDTGFREMALAYVDAFPSTHPSVRYLGRDLAGFLAREPAWAAHPALSEMAAFEWAWGLAFDAADAGTVTAAALEGVAADAWAGLTVSIHPSLQRVELKTNVPALFEAATADTPPPAVIESAEAVSWILWRRDLRVHWRSQDADEAWALSAAAEAQSFAGLCDGLCQWHEPEAVPLRAASLLRSWLADGLLTALHC